MTIHLGFEVGTGRAIAVPMAHMAVTGQTQASGKTTTLEALVSRSGATALTFVTKRGEASFATGRRVQPYFRDRADWQFVDNLLSATLQEKNKFLRPWIMKICRTTRTMSDVHERVRDALLTAKGINEGVYTQLDAYLDLIVPEIERADLAETLDLAPGLNVMDVSEFATPMQMLFVQSAIDWVNERCRNTIVVVPEAWEFIPEGKGSPVKASAVTLVRKGAALGNFIWVDSQDMAGVDKTILRGCTVWLMGVQREANEIKRNLQNIPAGTAKPKPEELALLSKGQFFACFGRTAAKTYVQPSWADELAARGVALGTTDLQTIIAQKPTEATVTEHEAQELRRRNEELAATVARLETATAEAAALKSASPPAQLDPQVIEEADAAGYARGYAQGKRAGVAEVAQTFAPIRAWLDEIDAAAGRELSAARPFAKVDTRGLVAVDALDAAPSMAGRIEALQATAAAPRRQRAPTDPNAVPAGVDKLLAALARIPAKMHVGWEQVCIVATIPHGNGYFYGARKYIVERGLVTETGDGVSITSAGLEAAGGRGPRLTRAEVIEAWAAKAKAPGGVMLRTIAKREDWISTEALAEKATNGKFGNGHWYGGVKAIRKPGLIEQDGGRFRLSEFVRALP